MTRQMLPLLKKSRGRIVNMSSIAGRVAARIAGPYTSSKHAMTGWTQVLRSEMKVWGITVSMVEPGFMATPLVSQQTFENTIKDAESWNSEEVLKQYSPNFTKLKENWAKVVNMAGE